MWECPEAGQADTFEGMFKNRLTEVPASVKKTGCAGAVFCCAFTEICRKAFRSSAVLCDSPQPSGGKGEMLTLKELKNMVETAKETERVPSNRMLRESGAAVAAKERIDAQTEITVYENGYVLYQVGRRSTVFPIHSCGGYTYEFDRKNSFSLKGDFFENENWYIRLILEGEDRMIKNED